MQRQAAKHPCTMGLPVCRWRYLGIHTKVLRSALRRMRNHRTAQCPTPQRRTQCSLRQRTRGSTWLCRRQATQCMRHRQPTHMRTLTQIPAMATSLTQCKDRCDELLARCMGLCLRAVCIMTRQLRDAMRFVILLRSSHQSAHVLTTDWLVQMPRAMYQAGQHQPVGPPPTAHCS
jgi:hypothetical protein